MGLILTGFLGQGMVEFNMHNAEHEKLNPISKKLKIVSDLFEMAVKIKTHQLKLKYPEQSAEEIKARVIELIEKGCR